MQLVYFSIEMCTNVVNIDCSPRYLTQNTCSKGYKTRARTCLRYSLKHKVNPIGTTANKDLLISKSAR
ncbi:hypothetical protein OPQ81_002302 [Rhizoctonia solani]|nr:hypothetical protein OPQ81_002302 [Rhizoctonia solani]